MNQLNSLGLLEQSWDSRGKWLQDLLGALKVGQSFLPKGCVILQTSKVSGILKYANCLLALVPCNLGGKSQAAVCAQHVSKGQMGTS